MYFFNYNIINMYIKRLRLLKLIILIYLNKSIRLLIEMKRVTLLFEVGVS